MEQFFCFFFFFFCFGGCNTTFIAASKTAFTFCKISEEFSRVTQIKAVHILELNPDVDLVNRNFSLTDAILTSTWFTSCHNLLQRDLELTNKTSKRERLTSTTLIWAGLNKNNQDQPAKNYLICSSGCYQTRGRMDCTRTCCVLELHSI